MVITVHLLLDTYIGFWKKNKKYMLISYERKTKHEDLNMQGYHKAVFMGEKELQKHFDKFGNTKLKNRQVQTLHFKLMMVALKTFRETLLAW